MFTNKVASKPQKFDIIAQSRLDVAKMLKSGSHVKFKFLDDI